MQPTLNEDCIHAIVQQCCGDYQTLYNLLTVNRSTFLSVVPFLYHDLRDTNTWSTFSQSRLEYLLGLSSGYVQAMYGPHQASNPPWSDSLSSTTPSTINYLNYVKYMRPDAFLMIWKPLKIPWVQFDLDMFINQMKFHGSKLATLMLTSRRISRALEMVHLFSILEKVEFKQPPHVQEFSVEESKMMQDFVQQHVELFPGVLQSVVLGGLSHNWGLFLKLQKIIGGPKYMQLAVPAAVAVSTGGGAAAEDTGMNLFQLPVAKLKSLHFVITGSISVPTTENNNNEHHYNNENHQALFFASCRALETLSVVSPSENAFKWAKLEQETQQRQQDQRLQYQPQRSSTLVQLKSLIYSGETLNALDAISGFRSSLETLELKFVASDQRSNSLSGWSFHLPKLRSLTLRNQPFDIDCLAEFCPALEILHIRVAAGTRLRPVVQGFPPLIRELVLNGDCFDYLYVGVFKSLHHLEVLDMCGGPPYTPVKSLKKVISTEGGWNFPKLKKVLLAEFWALAFQGSLLQVAPNLQELVIMAPMFRSGVLMLETFYPLESTMFIDPERIEKEQAIVQYPSLTSLYIGSFSLPSSGTGSQHNKINGGGQQKFKLEALVSETGMFPNLNHLTLDKLRGIEENEYDQTVDLAMHHPKLKTIDVHSTEWDRDHFASRYNVITQDPSSTRKHPLKDGCTLVYCQNSYALK